MAQLCVTIGAPTLAALRERRDAATRYGDLVELRLDTLADPDPAGALQGRTGPVIVTCRPTWEGGHFAGSEETRLRLLKQAWDLGAEFVDVEWASLADAPWARGERLVLSSHDFHGVPFDMAARYAAMHAAEPGVVKLAVTAARLTDTLALLGLKPPSNRRQVLLAMGAPGLVTRLAPDRFGSAWTYAGDGWAPGQIPADRVRREFRFGSISPRAGLYGVVARPSGHSVSPAMHNHALRGGRARRAVRAARSGDRRRLPHVRRRDGRARRQRDAAVQDRPASPRRGRRVLAPRRRRQHRAPRRPALVGDEHRRRGTARAAPAAHEPGRCACDGARRGRSRPGGGRGAGRGRRARHRASPARRSRGRHCRVLRRISSARCRRRAAAGI